jgi:hypothetical protein
VPRFLRTQCGEFRRSISAAPASLRRMAAALWSLPRVSRTMKSLADIAASGCRVGPGFSTPGGRAVKRATYAPGAGSATRGARPPAAGAISARAARVPFRRRATDPTSCRAGSDKRRAVLAAVGRRREQGPPISGAAGAKIGVCSLAWHHGGSRKIAFSLNSRGRLSRSGHRCPGTPRPGGGAFLSAGDRASFPCPRAGG